MGPQTLDRPFKSDIALKYFVCKVKWGKKKMKNNLSVKEVFEKFKNLPLGKQSLVSVTVIAIVIAILSNYKNIKKSSRDIINAFIKDEGVREFMDDVDKVIKSFANVVKKFISGEDIKEVQADENK